MRNYETIVIIKPSVAEDGITSIIERTQGIIEGDGGAVAKVDKWGLRKLAYLIKKEQQGYYVLIESTATPEAIAEAERIFKIDDRVLKYMTVRLAALSAPETEEEETPEAAEAETETAAE